MKFGCWILTHCESWPALLATRYLSLQLLITERYAGHYRKGDDKGSDQGYHSRPGLLPPSWFQPLCDYFHLLIFCGRPRVGEISSFIAKPVLRGFVFGLAIFITLKQLPQIVGVHTDHDGLMQFLPELFSEIPAWNAASITIAVKP